MGTDLHNCLLSSTKQTMFKTAVVVVLVLVTMCEALWVPKCVSNKKRTTCGGCDITCDSINIMIPCTKICRRKCECPKGTVWSALNFACIPPSACNSLNSV